MAAPNLQHRKDYADDTAYYDAIRRRFQALATEYAKKISFGICSDLYDELMCLKAKLYWMEIILGIDSTTDLPWTFEQLDPLNPAQATTQNNVITSKFYGILNLVTGSSNTIQHVVDLLNSTTLVIAPEEIHIASVVATTMRSGQPIPVLQKYVVKPGKGTYGTETVLNTSNLEFLYQEDLGDMERGISVHYINLVDLGGFSIEAHINSSNSNDYILNDSQAHVFIAGDKRYIYKGAQPVTLGMGNTMVSNTNFHEFTVYKRNTSSLTNDGENGVDPFVTQVDVDNSLSNYYDKPEVEALIGNSIDKSYVHNQTGPSSTWNIVHNLDKYPSITIIDDVGDSVEGQIAYTNTNTMVVSFNTPFKGTAYLN